MKKLLLAMCLCMAVVMVVAPAYAEELWDYHLRGVDEGLAAGACRLLAFTSFTTPILRFPTIPWF